MTAQRPSATSRSPTTAATATERCRASSTSIPSASDTARTDSSVPFLTFISTKTYKEVPHPFRLTSRG